MGDILFFVSSLFWAAFTVLIRWWKVDAIKALRVFSKCVDERCLKWPGLYDEYENDFYEFLLDHGKTFYEGPDSRSLGLKDAKGVVDVMFANLDAL